MSSRFLREVKRSSKSYNEYLTHILLRERWARCVLIESVYITGGKQLPAFFVLVTN